MPQERIVAKGNRVTDIQDDDGVEIIGYRLYTGAEGEETEDASYCGTRQAEYLTANHPGLRKVPQLQHECAEHPDWDCWQIVESVSAGPGEVVCEEPTGKKRQKRPAS